MNWTHSSKLINKKSYISAIITLTFLMIVSGMLTKIIPSGKYINNTFQYIEKEPYPVWRWVLAPFEVLVKGNSFVIIMIIFFLLLVGGSIAALKEAKILQFLIMNISEKFSENKKLLIFVLCFLFMSLGAFLGIFEEIIPLIPFIVLLSWSLGWDTLMGLGLSLVSCGFGFASAVLNPFTIGVAQTLANVPIFSGALLRILIFLITYLILVTFLINYSKKLEKDKYSSPVYFQDLKSKESYNIVDYSLLNNNDNFKKAVENFLFFMMILFVLIILPFFIKSFSNYTLILISINILAASITTCYQTGMSFHDILKIIFKGMLALLPVILLILMASSINYIITTGGILYTLIFYCSKAINSAPPILSILIIYLIVLVLNFFISSGCAKAFLIIPLLVPLAEVIGVDKQLIILAFQFGDGFSNIIFPTNAVLLISLGLSNVSYSTWFKWLIKLQLLMLGATSLLLCLAYFIGYK
ncbi:hypothetical protein [Oceanirhabdus sp. W0125-5]|uniref:hypothetical protein n=1 Tax=Oceanirhabdus sp. W0125-5 TaxID=2999116 RepID=UPI0022F31BC1|nr:hypothetical protein [Oceanirhabdus sp. W0125-5]WBW99170.1 hypothetical protein OW730_10605 [Oceanirhabdus sp. W0125-5]